MDESQYVDALEALIETWSADMSGVLKDISSTTYREDRHAQTRRRLESDVPRWLGESARAAQQLYAGAATTWHGDSSWRGGDTEQTVTFDEALAAVRDIAARNTHGNTPAWLDTIHSITDLADLDPGARRSCLGALACAASTTAGIRMTRESHDAPRYARIPMGPVTCAWCVMLASQGAVYTGADTAASPGHLNDDCAIVPSWDGTDAIPHLDHWRRMTDAASTGVTGGRDEFLAALRETFPYDLTDGDTPGDVFFDDGPASWERSLTFGDWRAMRAGIAGMYSWADDATPGTSIPPVDPTPLPRILQGLEGGPRAREWNHILYGDKTGGGHLPGYGWRDTRTTPYPADWPSDRIAGMIAEYLPGAYAEANGVEKPVERNVPGLGMVKFAFRMHDGALRLASVYPMGRTA